MFEVIVRTQEAQVVLPMAVRQYAFEGNLLTWIQRGPFCDLLFQSPVPTGVPKRASDLLSDAVKETIAQR